MLASKLSTALLGIVLLLSGSSYVSGKAPRFGLEGRQQRRRLNQLPYPASAQLFFDGILQEAYLDDSCKTDRTCGGNLTVNGVTITVPKNLIVFFPAQAYTWQEMFLNQSKSYLALNDPPKPAGMIYTVTVTANRLANGQVIAGMIDIAQDALVTASGYIDAIDYKTGELAIEINGGTGARVRINDFKGRYGRVQTGPGFDERFSVDIDNPTIHAGTGFPHCIPRTLDGKTIDPLCPFYNRPTVNSKPTYAFTMGAPGNKKALDPLQMAPLMVGDYVTFAGILSGPEPTDFIAAYSIVSNVAIYTQAGVDPAYAVIEGAVMGTGGQNVLALMEAADRTVFEGFSTDPTRMVHLYGVDYAPDGTTTLRDFGTTTPDPGFALGGAVQGRWKMQSPCVFITKKPTFKQCTPPEGGVYTPAPREIMVKIEGCNPKPGAANGISSGGCSYVSPTIEYIWPENIPGTPVVENNFGVLDFLMGGGYVSTKGTVVGVLDPWPSNNPPDTTCSKPTIDLGGPYQASAGGSVTLTATCDGASTYNYVWTPVQPDKCGSTDNKNGLKVSYKGITAAANTTITYALTVINQASKCPRNQNWTMSVDVPIVNGAVILPIKDQYVDCGGQANFTAVLSSGNAADFKWNADPAITIVSQDPDPTAVGYKATSQSTLTFNVPYFCPWTTAQPYAFSVTAGASNTVSMNALVKPRPDILIFPAGGVKFICTQHRLVLTVVSSFLTGTELRLMNYLRNDQKAIVDVARIGNKFTDTGGGIHVLDLASVPMPYWGEDLKVVSKWGGVALRPVNPSDIRGGLCFI